MFENIDAIVEYLPVLVPLVVLQLGLMVGALVHLLRRKSVRRGSVGLWAAIIVLVNIIGPALYFLIGREEN
jgi:hypothetical protein